jgi:hypothetical protein
VKIKLKKMFLKQVYKRKKWKITKILENYTPRYATSKSLGILERTPKTKFSNLQENFLKLRH